MTIQTDHFGLNTSRPNFIYTYYHHTSNTTSLSSFVNVDGIEDFLSLFGLIGVWHVKYKNEQI